MGSLIPCIVLLSLVIFIVIRNRRALQNPAAAETIQNETDEVGSNHGHSSIHNSESESEPETDFRNRESSFLNAPSLEENMEWMAQQGSANTAEEDEDFDRRMAKRTELDRQELTAERKRLLESQFLRLSTESFSLTMTMKRFELGSQEIPISSFYQTRRIPGPKAFQIEPEGETYRKWLEKDITITERELREGNEPLAIKMRKLLYCVRYGKFKQAEKSSSANSSV